MTHPIRSITSITTINHDQFEGNGAPLDTLGYVGDRYFDLDANQWYVKRVLGNLNGSDNIILPSQLSYSAISIVEMTFKTSATFGSDGNSDLFGGELACKVRSSGGLLNILIGNAGGSAWAVAGEAISPILNNSTWYKVRVEINNSLGTVRAFINDQLTYTKTGQSVNTATGNFRFGTIDMVPGGTLICNCKFNTITLPIADGTGAQIDDSNGNVAGTLTDATPVDFWKEGYVPLEFA